MKLTPVWLAAAAAASITPFDSSSFCSTSVSPTCNATVAYINTLNKHLRPVVAQLVQTDYFGYYTLNLFKKCPFWESEGFCVNRNCAVDWEDWLTVPERLRPAALGSMEIDTSNNYCLLEDEHDDENVLVLLVANPERFTGYGGEQSAQIWNYIYKENCFSGAEACVETKAFYRLISGMHASIAVHLSNEYLDTKTGKYHPNLPLFMDRVGNHNERLANVYFNYAVVGQALAKLVLRQAELLPVMPGATKLELDAVLRTLTGKVLPALQKQPLFDESSLFGENPLLKDEFRARFRNVLAIMDCVGCDRCRLWGKVQTTGYGTALKLLFDADEAEVNVSKQEVVALVNTFDRLTKLVASIAMFKEMYFASLTSGEPDNELEFPFQEKFWQLHAVLVADTEGDESESDFENYLDDEDEVTGPNPYLRVPPARLGQVSFWEELDVVLQVCKFVLSLYAQFPKIVWTTGVYYARGYWNWFIGNYAYDYKQVYKDMFDGIKLDISWRDRF